VSDAYKATTSKPSNGTSFDNLEWPGFQGPHLWTQKTLFYNASYCPTADNLFT